MFYRYEEDNEWGFLTPHPPWCILPSPTPKHSLVSGHKPLMFPTRVMFVHFHLLVAGVARRRAGDKALNMLNMHIVTGKLRNYFEKYYLF